MIDRRFEALVFDWDGTAVPDRASDASGVRTLVEALCAAGMHVAVVTGTHVGNVDGQLGARPTGPGRLLLAVNRGSEVFEVDATGPRLVYRRDATDAENAALDRAAALTVERLADAGLATLLVSQRLNRRKIDLIPLAEWADPPKAQIDRLLNAVESRLRVAGIAGLPAVVARAEDAARVAGLATPRVTSDTKHVEIGLTDKSDAATYLFRTLWEEGIGPSLVLIAGDELGPLGGLPGSDSLMLVPQATGASCLSVGVEPTGVPAGVVHLGGGPARFREVLEDQLRRRHDHGVPHVDLQAGWAVSFAGIDHEHERAIESVLTIADGTIGTVGAPLRAHASATPGVLVSGLYRGERVTADLLGAPRWDRLQESTTDGKLQRSLDLHTGVLAEQADTGVTLRSVRFSSLARPGTSVLRVEMPPAGIPGPALRDVDDAFDGVERLAGAPEYAFVQGKELAAGIAATQQLHDDGVLDRVAFYAPVRSPSEAARTAKEGLADACAVGFDALLAEHRRAWARRWDRADIRVDGDDELQLRIRLALFHLMASVGDHGEAAVGARGLTGHGYRGHVFWDSDVFVLPFLAATHPPAARAMLEYRLRRLPMALDAARAEGRRGARFPWESAALGDDVTPRFVRNRAGGTIPIRTGSAEVHIVADVAWAACFYADWSGDTAFISGPGHRLLVETARYWASRVRVAQDGAHIFGVIGPDEYHEPVDDNMFTNVMARWNLRRAARSAQRHGGVDDGELSAWLQIADALVDGYDTETGIYEQFAGFQRLEPLLISAVAPQRPIVADLLLGRDRVEGAQVVKQPDVLMAHHLVPEECAAGSLLPNLAYYEPRTAHGSSLSPGIHASLFARAAQFDAALHWLRVAADVDLADTSQTAAAGVHLATMGSLWQAIAFGFAGLRAGEDALSLDPRLPGEWGQLDVAVQYHGVPVQIRVTCDETHVTAPAPVSVVFGDGTVRACGPEGVSVANH